VRFAPAREDLTTYEALGDPAYPQRHAIEGIARGQVLVMEGRGTADAACAGDILVARLVSRGAAGLVVDAGIRDFLSAQASGLSIYCLGPAAPAHVLVLPGDIMVGDGEGVVCVPRGVADQVAAKGLEQEELEAFVLQKIKAGAPLPGTYPPGPATVAEYEAWKSARRPMS
jgi:regulator of RNase E activity RraA